MATPGGAAQYVASQVHLHHTTSGEQTSGERTSGDSGMGGAGRPHRTSGGSHADSFGSSHLPAVSVSTGTEIRL